MVAAGSTVPVREAPEDDSSTWRHRDRSHQSHRNSSPVTRGDAVVTPATCTHLGGVHQCCASAAPGACTPTSSAGLNYLSKPQGVTQKGPSCVSKGPFGCASLPRRGRKYPARFYKLDVHVTQGGFGWGLWQQSEWLRQSLGSWSQLWKAAEVLYSLTEKQLAAV